MRETLTQLVPPSWERLSSFAFELCWLEREHTTEGQWALSQREVSLGSHPDALVCVEEPSVSRQHAKICVEPEGHVIYDQGSKNGLWVNGVRVKVAYLSHGDTISLGRARLRYTLNEAQPVEHLLSRHVSFGRMLGESPQMRSLFAQLERVASSEATLLIEGESGTGKELAAEAVHQRSPRAQGPFVVFDCSAVSASLIESELFGHAKGAFTGASTEREGAFRRAEGGTLFLDELGELPLELQPRLLRALERREIKPVGADRYHSVSVRVIAATNRSLRAEVEQHQFRADLYYRLAVIKFTLPPLREHPQDIPLLVRSFLNELSPERPREVSYEAMLKLKAQPWQGNVRELKNFVLRALALSHTPEGHLETRYLLPQDLSLPLQEPTQEHTDSTGEAQKNEAIDEPLTAYLPSLGPHNETISFKDAKARLIDRFERLYWERLLNAHEWNVSAAARDAGIHRKSAEYLIKKLGLCPPS